MQIDWVTVAAQIINFLVLVWLLNRFLYRPITKTMKAREERITERLRLAQIREEEARAEAENYRRLHARLEADREALMDAAREDAEALKHRLQTEIREEIAALRRAWREEIDAERLAFLEQTREQTADAFLQLARSVLSDLASADIEDMIAARFARELSSLSADAVKRLRVSASEDGNEAVIRSTFELKSQRRKEITASVHKLIGEAITLEYERAEDQISGIELRIGSQIVRWSLDSYLDDLEARLRDAIRMPAPAGSSQAGPEH